jgi:hypothetical protein
MRPAKNSSAEYLTMGWRSSRCEEITGSVSWGLSGGLWSLGTEGGEQWAPWRRGGGTEGGCGAWMNPATRSPPPPPPPPPLRRPPLLPFWRATARERDTGEAWLVGHQMC